MKSQTFEQTYPRYGFAPLVDLGIALAKALVHIGRWFRPTPTAVGHGA